MSQIPLGQVCDDPKCENFETGYFNSCFKDGHAYKENGSDLYNLRKHPELFYLGDCKFHVCPKCLKGWYCETIINYGVHDQSETVEVCYKCSGNKNKKFKVDKNLPEFIVKALIESNKDAHRHADKIRAEENAKLQKYDGKIIETIQSHVKISFDDFCKIYDDDTIQGQLRKLIQCGLVTLNDGILEARK